MNGAVGSRALLDGGILALYHLPGQLLKSSTMSQCLDIVPQAAGKWLEFVTCDGNSYTAISEKLPQCPQIFLYTVTFQESVGELR